MSTQCAGCDKPVYLAERIQSLGKYWHKTCHACQECKKSLPLGVGSDHGGKPYCEACYSRLFKPRGYGYGTGAGVLSPEVGTGKAQASLSKSSVPKVSSTKKKIEKSVASLDPKPAPKPIQSSGSKKFQFGGAPKCKRCTKSVYAAEKVTAIGSTWHKTCFSCEGCKKSLAASEANDHAGMPYCKGCYMKSFGPKGIGYGGALGDTGIARPKN